MWSLSWGYWKSGAHSYRSPYSSAIHGSKHGHMRELRIQHRGHPYRVLYAFDPRRTAILLLGGGKTGKGDWYDKMVPKADRLYDQHLEELRRESQENTRPKKNGKKV